MRQIFLTIGIMVMLSACSETRIEEQNDAEIAETEKQIEADAKSLEEAAAEAVRVLEADIEAELADDGIDQPGPSLTTVQENNQP